MKNTLAEMKDVFSGLNTKMGTIKERIYVLENRSIEIT